uniref:Uncharacterized protein n=1 Tax=Rhizophora mucronata TaxID=61149 RepID=A0A2P2NQ50_RHIMU
MHPMTHQQNYLVGLRLGNRGTKKKNARKSNRRERVK